MNDKNTILLVEDDDALRRLIARRLSRVGYDVLDACSGPDALAALDARPQRVDLLVTDLIMPRMSGRDLAERLRVRFPELRVLLASGFRGEAIRRYGIREDDPAFLPKPYDVEVLLAAIERELAS